MKDITSVDHYISTYPPQTQAILQKIRKIVHSEVPGIQEKISYGIPAFSLDEKYLIYMAAYPKHVAVYPLRTGSTPFDKELAPYHSGTATIKFPLGKPIPWPLIKKIVKFKANQHPANTE